MGEALEKVLKGVAIIDNKFREVINDLRYKGVAIILVVIIIEVGLLNAIDKITILIQFFRR